MVSFLVDRGVDLSIIPALVKKYSWITLSKRVSTLTRIGVEVNLKNMNRSTFDSLLTSKEALKDFLIGLDFSLNNKDVQALIESDIGVGTVRELVNYLVAVRESFKTEDRERLLPKSVIPVLIMSFSQEVLMDRVNALMQCREEGMDVAINANTMSDETFHQIQRKRLALLAGKGERGMEEEPEQPEEPEQGILAEPVRIMTDEEEAATQRALAQVDEALALAGTKAK